MSAGTEAKKKGMDVIGSAVDKAMRAVAMETVSRVMLRTPVDTGRARANWNVSMDAPIDATSDFADWQGALDGNVGTANAADFNFAGRRRALFLANGLPYIERLEAGWSKQAPAGMVALTLAEMQSFVESSALSVTLGGDDGE